MTIEITDAYTIDKSIYELSVTLDDGRECLVTACYTTHSNLLSDQFSVDARETYDSDEELDLSSDEHEALKQRIKSFIESERQ
jgi:hypothetical protein